MQKTMNLRNLTGMVASLMWIGSVTPSLANPTELNFISEIKGEVQLKRSEWNGYQRANVGDLLNPPDQLQLGAGASATIMCSNLSIWVLEGSSEAQVSDGCPTGILTQSRPNSIRDRTRAPNETIPYIISPRNTALLTNRPILLWNAVPGATRYRVRIQDAGLTLDWQTETSNTAIEYPGEPPLQSDSYYFLIVETDKGDSSEEEQGTNLGFTLLDQEKAESLQTEVAKLKKQQLAQEAEVLALAYLYQSYDLKAEAIELLEALLEQGSQTAAVYQLLGDLYLQVGLSQQAKSPYLKALEIGKQTKDIEGQAEAQVGLGKVAYGLGEDSEAREWLTQAQTNYNKLGDKLKVEEVQQWSENFR